MGFWVILITMYFLLGRTLTNIKTRDSMLVKVTEAGGLLHMNIQREWGSYLLLMFNLNHLLFRLIISSLIRTKMDFRLTVPIIFKDFHKMLKYRSLISTWWNSIHPTVSQ